MARMLAAAMAIGALLLPPCAHAQRGSAARYQRIIRSAVAEFDAGRWGEARALFREAHELDPSARTLRGIGMCSFELREYGAALRDLVAATEATDRPLTPAQRRQVDDLIARARTFVGRYRLVVDPHDAAITIDGAPPHAEPDGTVLLDIGRHELVATSASYERSTRVLTVQGGEDDTVEVSLAPEVPPEVALAPPVVQYAPDPPRDEPNLLTPLGLVLMAGGGAVLATGLFGIGWFVDRERELSLCDAAGDECLNRGALAAQHEGATALVGIGVALGSAAVGVGATLVPIGESRRSGHAALRCVPGALGLVCSGQF